MTEDQLQAKCHQLTWNYFPQLRRKWWAVPNGGHRNPVEAKKLQACGVIPGVWDIHFYVQSRLLIIEMKVEYNKLSQPQEAWRDLMVGEGADWVVVRTVEQWKHAVWTRVLGYQPAGPGWQAWIEYNC